jgi:TetR/AcrR family transcriptional repressor of nem operon
MPWDKTHKAETRRRIVEAAAAALRSQGLAGAGVAGIMKQAGLTHGGFYAHFSDKEALAAEALREADAQTEAWLGKAAEGAAPERKLLAIADAYLSRLHREHPERGCPLATLGPEAVRAGGAAGMALAESVGTRLKRLETLAPATTDAGRRQRATGALAAMAGGMLLARAAGGSEEAERILADTRAFLRAALAVPLAAGRNRRA